MYWRQCRPLK
uniref:Uncharacterized protein n=1 Tax=Rhizophora mucronata TaxID=61149 RepID=A0A2P2J077_RHIMU